MSRFHAEANEDVAACTTVIDLKLVNLAVAGQVLLEDAAVILHPGRVYGLTGRNGVGKSTLLRQLAVPGKLIPQHVRTLLVEQEDAGDSRTALQTVVEADTNLGTLLAAESLIQAALDSGDEVRAATAVAEIRAQRLRAEAERLGRLVDRTSGARGQSHRMRWIQVEKDARRADQALASIRFSGGSPSSGREENKEEVEEEEGNKEEEVEEEEEGNKEVEAEEEDGEKE